MRVGTTWPFSLHRRKEIKAQMSVKFCLSCLTANSIIMRSVRTCVHCFGLWRKRLRFFEFAEQNFQCDSGHFPIGSDFRVMPLFPARWSQSQNLGIFFLLKNDASYFFLKSKSNFITIIVTKLSIGA